MLFSYFLLIYYVQLTTSWVLEEEKDFFSDYSSQFKVKSTGFMVSFGDFNADRATDIFILDQINGTLQLDVILMINDRNDNFHRISLLRNIGNDIAGVMAGDFNGDSILDLLIYRSKKKIYTTEIAYGMNNRSGLLPLVPISDVICTTPPLHMDWNTDMIGDLFCQLENKSFVVWIGHKNTSFVLKNIDIDKYKMDVLLHLKFLDINGDNQVDILLIGKSKNGTLVMIALKKKDNQFIAWKHFLSEITACKIGHGVTADFSLSGKLSMVVPICRDETCADSSLLICDLNDFTCNDSFTSMYIDDSKMQFVSGDTVTRLSLAVPELAPLSCGDLFLTGLIICLTTMARVNDLNDIRTVMLVNKGHGSFSIQNFTKSQNLFSDVVQVAIFDIKEDGIPDVLAVKRDGPSGQIIPFLHNDLSDQYFLKVMVLGGLCSGLGHCPGHTLPYGIPLPGVSVSYVTENGEGGTQTAMAPICPDSGYTSLQLPYVHFGLGTVANYVEKLFVMLQYKNKPRRHTINFIVPKTQIVIIPYPLDDPSKWTNKLFLDPFGNNNPIYVAIALLSSFLVIAVVTSILQYLEYCSNQLEKKEEAQKFHFNAM